MPLAAVPLPESGGLSFSQVEIAAIIGLAAGWIALDRLSSLRVGLWAIAGAVLAMLLAGLAFAWLASGLVDLHLGRTRAATIAISFLVGGLVRGAAADRRSMASLVALAGATSWLTYDMARLPYRPLRDLELYLEAGSTALHGTLPYLRAPLPPGPAAPDLPFVYPPPTIPIFELLASIPRPVAETIWVVGSVAAVVAALWLLGVRGRWLLVLLAWPPLAVGLAVGNVASFTFLLFVAGFRFGALLILGGMFKPQSTIPALWLVRERRWRSIAVGIGILASVALVALPFTGLEAWPAWLNALWSFQASVAAFPSIEGLALVRGVGTSLALVVTVVAIGLAFIGRGRNGIARFGLASILASPTLYLHGLSPLLPGALFLGPELLWFVLGLGPWWIGFQSAWLAVAVVGLALLLARDGELRLPADLSPARADVHPLGRLGQVWPDSAALDRVVARSAANATPPSGEASPTP
jgi:hypothetical protein